MVCDGPDPPDTSPHELTPPPIHNLVTNAEDSDEEQGDYVGYEPLPQGPEGFLAESAVSDDEDSMDSNPEATDSVPQIEAMDHALTREVWSAPRASDPIQMDNERAQQVMTAMANFVLPQTSIPDWAQSVTEEQWKQTLNDRIEKIKKPT